MKRLLSFLLLSFCLFPIAALPAGARTVQYPTRTLSVAAAQAPIDRATEENDCLTAESVVMPDVSAEAAALCDAASGRILCGKNETRRLPMASTTKVMTALVTLESLPLTAVIRIPKEAVGVEGSSVYLRAGDAYTVEALLYALLLQSANDAAAALAYAVAGSLPAFAEKMNNRAAELGLSGTHFVTPHGLDDPEHYTTAADLAKIAAAALENPDFARIVSTRRYLFTTVDHTLPRALVNHNKMLIFYDGAVGVKTGFTKKSGRCLVSAARRDGLLLVSVTLNAPSDWSDHKKMLDYGFAEYESRVLAAPGELTISLPLFNTDGECFATNRDEIRMTLRRGQALPAPAYDILPHPTLPQKAGQFAGEVVFGRGDEAVSSPMIFTEDLALPKTKKGWFGIFR